MIRIIPAACATMFLTACAPMPPDDFGNEPRPFGFDASFVTPDRYDVQVMDSRGSLIERCHDLEGYVSRDGLNCVVTDYHYTRNTDAKYCTMYFVADKPRDMGWATAVCSGLWIPGEV